MYTGHAALLHLGSSVQVRMHADFWVAARCAACALYSCLLGRLAFPPATRCLQLNVSPLWQPYLRQFTAYMSDL